MLDHLNKEEQNWLVSETISAVARKLPEDAHCMMPNCDNSATGRMPFFSVSTRFCTELYLCDRCHEMIENAQFANVEIQKE